MSGPNLRDFAAARVIGRMRFERTRLVLGLALLVGAACTLGSIRNIVTSNEIASVPAAAANNDADILFVGDATGKMAQVDPSTGNIVNSVFTWSGTNSNVVAMTPDAVDSSRVWALHADGFIVNWAAGPSVVDWFWPPPFGGGERILCDVDHAPDGDVYVATVENGQERLWRRDGDTLVWMSTDLDDDGCTRVAHDHLHDELFLLASDGFTLLEHDPDTLLPLDSTVLDADGGGLRDIDVLGEILVAAGNSGVPSGTPPGGAPPIPSFSLAYVYDVSTGDLLDSKITNIAFPTSVDITVNGNTGTGEMLISASAGANTLRGITLEED